LKSVLARAFPQYLSWQDELPKLFGAYVAAKQKQGVLDYDDLLLYWAQMVAEPSFAAAIGDRYDHILVDEYQDTNRLQASILMALKPDGRGLTVVGDDAQAIYAWLMLPHPCSRGRFSERYQRVRDDAKNHMFTDSRITPCRRRGRARHSLRSGSD